MAIYAERRLAKLAGLLVGVLSAYPAAGDVPRTPWGVPDMNGVWKFSVATPLERPDALVDQSNFSEAEAAAFLANSEVRLDELSRSFDKDYVGQELWVPTDTPLTRDLRTSLIYEPANGKVPHTDSSLYRLTDNPYFDTPAGPEDRPAYERCIIGFNVGPPLDTTFEYNDVAQIFQTKNTVVIMTEMVNDARVIPLDGRPHLSERIRQWRGDSRGYWEGDTLVVVTQNFSGKTKYMGSGENLRLTERFTRVDEQVLEYDFRVEDAEHFATPWAARTELRKSEFPVFEYACHEHNRSMEYTLSGARAEEARQAAAETGE